MTDDDHDEEHGYSGLAIWVNAAVAVLVTVLVIWWASAFEIGFEQLFRVSPTPEAGIGAEFAAGRAGGLLGGLIALIHLADVVMGLFILAMVFVHWGAFRRLAARMRQPGEDRRPGDAATDGGTRRTSGSQETEGPQSGAERPPPEAEDSRRGGGDPPDGGVRP